MSNLKIFYPKFNFYHNPTKDYSDGFPPFDFLEVYKRVELIKDGLLEIDGCEIINVYDFLKLDVLYKVHERKYIDFLMEISNKLYDNEEYIPSIFRADLDDAPIRFKGGMFCKEIGTPIQKNTFKAALNSAQTALEAAKYVYFNKKNAFALTRPPGHHAKSNAYGGYCFINNVIIASNYFLEKSQKPVILDIDYHIGDGTIQLAEKFNVPYFSLHIDPWKNYPYIDKYTKFKDNIYLKHLKHETNSKEYIKILSDMLDKINSFEFDVLILSLGFDILQTDYCQDDFLLICNKDFYTISNTIVKKIDKNILICLEGGYDMLNLKDCAKEFVNGFLSKGKNEK